MKDIQIILPFAPRTKKNSSRVVRTGRFTKVLPSKNYVELENKCCKFLKSWNQEPITTPVNIECHFYMDRNFNSDLVGYLQAIQDIMIKAKIIADDNHKIIASTDGSRVHLDRLNPRIEVYISEVQNVV